MTRLTGPPQRSHSADPDACHPRIGGQAGDQDWQGILHLLGRRDGPADAEEGAGLALPALRALRLVALQAGQPPDAHADRQQQDQGQDVLGIRHHERELGRQKEEVVGQEGAQGRPDGGPAAAQIRHQRDGQEKKRRRISHSGALFQQEDAERGRSERGQRDPDRAGQRPEVDPTQRRHVAIVDRWLEVP
jgi:hypothetical protein